MDLTCYPAWVSHFVADGCFRCQLYTYFAQLLLLSSVSTLAQIAASSAYDHRHCCTPVGPVTYRSMMEQNCNVWTERVILTEKVAMVSPILQSLI